MKLSYFGHSCFSVVIGGKTLLFDPFISPNELAAKIDPGKIQADYILLSHGHEDHVADAVAIAKSTGAKVIANFEVYLWLTRQGVSNAHPMNHGGKFSFDFGTVKMVNAVHSSMLPDGSYGGNPAGFVVEHHDDGGFYYSGDSALTYDMKLIGETTQLRFAVLPIGDNFTMGAEDAATAADFVGVKEVVGVHYDTFPPIVIDKEKVKKVFKEAGKSLHLPGIGETIVL